MRVVSAGLSALIVSANPVLTAAFAAVWLKERMSLRKAAGLVLGVMGVALIVANRIARGLDSAIGIGMVIGGMLALVGGTILFKRLEPKRGLWIGNGVQNLVGGLALAPFALTFEGIREIAPSWQLGFRARLPGLHGLNLRLSPGASSANDFWRNHRERLSLPDATAWPAVRLGSAWRASRRDRPCRHPTGSTWNLLGDAAGQRIVPLTRPRKGSSCPRSLCGGVPSFTLSAANRRGESARVFLRFRASRVRTRRWRRRPVLGANQGDPDPHEYRRCQSPVSPRS
jgi:hypothetical protein